MGKRIGTNFTISKRVVPICSLQHNTRRVKLQNQHHKFVYAIITIALTTVFNSCEGFLRLRDSAFIKTKDGWGNQGRSCCGSGIKFVMKQKQQAVRVRCFINSRVKLSSGSVYKLGSSVLVFPS